jgi:hypothetical protein
MQAKIEAARNRLALIQTWPTAGAAAGMRDAYSCPLFGIRRAVNHGLRSLYEG